MSVLEQDASVATLPLIGTIETTETSPSRTSATPTSRSVSTVRCVVVSTDAERRSMLVDAANEAGWDTIVCADADSGWSAVKRQKFQLAIIDIDGVEDAEQLKGLGEEIADMGDTLLMLCGNEGEALEEIWARQLGVWLYLPGVDQGSDISSLCEQACPVAEKLLGLPGHFVG